MASVGKNMRTLRKKQNMTQDSLADKLYVTRQTISNYEIGKTQPDIDTLVKIAEALDTDTNALIYGIPTPPNHKKEYRRLIVACAAAALYGVLVFSFMSAAREWAQTYYVAGPLLLMQTLAISAFFVLLGWTVMQAIGVIMRAKSFAGKCFRIVHYLLIAALILYAVIILPYEVRFIDGSIRQYRYITGGGNWEFSYTFDFLPWWDFIAWKIMQVVLRWSFLFLLPGAALWATKITNNLNAVRVPD